MAKTAMSNNTARSDRLFAFWKVLAFVLLFYYFVPVKDDSYGNIYHAWGGFTNQTLQYGSRQSIWLSLYHVYIVVAGYALMMISKKNLGFVRSISYLSIGIVGILGVQWLHPVSARIVSLTVALFFGALLAGYLYRKNRLDSAPGWKYRTIDKVRFAALFTALNAIAVLFDTDGIAFLLVLFVIYFNVAVLVFGTMRVISFGCSKDSPGAKLSMAVLFSWFVINLFLAFYFQSVSEFSGKIPFAVKYLGLQLYAFCFLMAITNGMSDLLSIRKGRS